MSAVSTSSLTTSKSATWIRLSLLDLIGFGNGPCALVGVSRLLCALALRNRYF
jgi:hypothetical protein